jgi:hypothetical protein
MASASPDPVADRTGLWFVIIVIGTMLIWAATANQLGGAVGLASAVLVGVVASCVTWRDRISYDLLSNIGLVGVPVLVVGLSLS